MENVIRIINNYDCQINWTDMLNNNIPTLLDFTDYLNLRMVCRELYSSIRQFLCFNISVEKYILYTQIRERGNLFLFYNNTSELVSQFLDLFYYIYGQVKADNVNIYGRYVNIERGPKELTEYYSNPELLNRFGILGITPLHAFVYYGKLDVVKILLNHGNINVKDLADETPLHVAIRCSHTDIARFIIKNTEIDLNVDNDFGETAFVLACEYGNSEIVKLLLQNGVDPTKQPHNTVNDLINSCIEHPDIIKILIDYTDNTQGLGSNVDYYLPLQLHHKNKTIENVKKSINILQHRFASQRSERSCDAAMLIKKMNNNKI